MDALDVAAALAKLSCGASTVCASLQESDSVRRLAPEQRASIGCHLARLTAEDRRLRFGMRLNEALIARYVAGIDFSHDQLLGVFAAESTLIGLAHLALDPAHWSAEIGLSVDLAYRNRGHGYGLLKRAIEHSASAGYRTLFMHCLSGNEIIKRLARRLGLIVITANGEADAQLELSREMHGTQLAKVTDRPALLIDSHFNKHVASSVEAGFPLAEADVIARIRSQSRST